MAFTSKTIHTCTMCWEAFDEIPSGHDCRSDEQKEKDRQEQKDFDKWAEAWGDIDEKDGIGNAAFSVDRKLPHHHAVRGRCVFINKDFEWGEGGKCFVSDVMYSPTWREVYKTFDESIEVCKDFHHIFLEGVGQIPWPAYAGTMPTFDEPVKIYVFHTGS
jgi:hypothetical protein